MARGPDTWIGETCTLELCTGQRVCGVLTASDGDWWLVTAGEAQVWVAIHHVMAVHFGEVSPPVGPQTTPKRAAVADAVGPQVRIQDDQLRMIAEALLDGELDRTIAQQYQLKPGLVRTLRRGFEAARGNLELDADDPAGTWVARWQIALRSPAE